jgi:hypothetical protein
MFGADRRAKDAASHRSMLIKLAEASLGIERRTRLVIREVFKALSSVLGPIEYAGNRISGEIRGQTRE